MHIVGFEVPFSLHSYPSGQEVHDLAYALNENVPGAHYYPYADPALSVKEPASVS